MSPANHNIEEAGDGASSLKGVLEKFLVRDGLVWRAGLSTIQVKMVEQRINAEV